MNTTAAATLAGLLVPRPQPVLVPVPAKRAEPTLEGEIAAAKKAIATAMATASLTAEEASLIDAAVDALYGQEPDIGFFEQQVTIRDADLRLTMDAREDLVLVTFGRWGRTPYVGFFVEGDAIPAGGSFSDAADLLA